MASEHTYAFHFLEVQWAGVGGPCKGKGSGALLFQRATPGPNSAGVCPLACLVEVVSPRLGGWPISAACVKTVSFPDRKKPVSVELSLLPLEGSAAPAEGMGKMGRSSTGSAAVSRSRTGERRLP